MSYILKRTDQGGGYVAPEGSERAYVKRPEKARRFPTPEAADRDRCGNEIIVDLDQELGL